MEQISIVFSKSSANFPIFSWLIMSAENTDYSHVSVKMIDDETNQVVYYQASHTMVNEMSEAEFLAQETIVYTFDFNISKEQKRTMKSFAIAQLGIPYGLLSIVGLAYVQLCKYLNISVQNPFKDNGKTYVCDQFVATLIQNSTKIVFTEDINNLTPSDLLPMVKQWPKDLC